MSMYSKLFSMLSMYMGKKSLQDITSLQLETGLPLSDIVTIVEQAIIYSKSECTPYKSTFKKLGGSNNLGFLVHRCQRSQIVLMTKISVSIFSDRERKFLQWHEANVPKVKKFAAKFVASGKLAESPQVEFLTTNKLARVKRPLDSKVLSLYNRSKLGKDYFDFEEQTVNFEGGTRIRDVLINLVCNKNKASSQAHLKSYFLERGEFLFSSKEQTKKWIETMLLFHQEIIENFTESDFGFVHGDFKVSNMLSDDQNELKLIDFQYYCLGFREWDLAFYLSKSKYDFNSRLEYFLESLDSRKSQKRLLFFSVVALFLHPKSNRTLELMNLLIPRLINQMKNLSIT